LHLSFITLPFYDCERNNYTDALQIMGIARGRSFASVTSRGPEVIFKIICWRWLQFLFAGPNFCNNEWAAQEKLFQSSCFWWLNAGRQKFFLCQFGWHIVNKLPVLYTGSRFSLIGP